MEYRCKNCGGELAWDPEISKLKCKFCDSTYDLSEYENQVPPEVHVHDHEHEHDHIHEQASAFASAASQGFDKATDDTTDIKEDLRIYQCPHCGAEVVTDKNTTATTCVFCSNPLVLKEQMEGTFKPDKVIPFEVDKKKIEELYENYIKNKPFYPEEYSTANVIEKIKGIYLPFWLFDFNTTGDLHATGERTATFTRGDWIVTDHNVFDLERAGQMHFGGVPVIASGKTPKDAMDAIEPYDYSKLKDFNTGYLPGFLAERYDRDENTCVGSVKERMSNSFNRQLTNTISGYSSVRILNGNMDHFKDKVHYALMPAYLLFMDYKNDEDKLIAINGQTGKIVGNVPVDKKKRNRYFIKWFLIISVVLCLVLLFLLL